MSELVRSAQTEPQEITAHGKPVAVLVTELTLAAARYRSFATAAQSGSLNPLEEITLS